MGVVTALRACGPSGGPVSKSDDQTHLRRDTGSRPRSFGRLYFRFTLSLRDVEDLLAECGIVVSYETIRRWVNHLGPIIATDLRRPRPKPHSIRIGTKSI
jgi:hypothetical protein